MLLYPDSSHLFDQCWHYVGGIVGMKLTNAMAQLHFALKLNVIASGWSNVLNKPNKPHAYMPI